MPISPVALGWLHLVFVPITSLEEGLWYLYQLWTRDIHQTLLHTRDAASEKGEQWPPHRASGNTGACRSVPQRVIALWRRLSVILLHLVSFKDAGVNVTTFSKAYKDRAQIAYMIPHSRFQLNLILFICVAHFHKLQMCLREFYNLYT